MNPICRTVIGKLHHRLPSISPHPRSFSNSSACDKESGLKRCFSASASCLTHCTVADTTSTSTKRDQPADTNGSDSSSKKQKVEEETPKKMSALRLGSVAPDFEAKTTQGPIKFHDFIDGSWTILFSCVASPHAACSSRWLGFPRKIVVQSRLVLRPVNGWSIDAS